MSEQVIGEPKYFVHKQTDNTLSAGVNPHETPKLPRKPSSLETAIRKGLNNAREFLTMAAGGHKATDLVSPEVAEINARLGEKVGKQTRPLET